MNYAIVLAAGVGQRMRNGGMPKQFLNLMGKPIIVYTLEKFEQCVDIDRIIVVCHGSYTDYMERLLALHQIEKAAQIAVGGNSRQSSLQRGLDAVEELGGGTEDIVVIHDGVRPLVSQNTIRENIRVARKYGCAVTVHPVTESVVITSSEDIRMENFQKRADTYSLTSPQSFCYGKIREAYQKEQKQTVQSEVIPLLDAAMVYAHSGGEVHLVKEQGASIKVTTPEDYYFLKAVLELEENRYVFGL